METETHPREYAGVHINLIGLCLDLSVADTTHQEEHVLRALHYAQEGLKYESRMFAREKFLTYDNLGQTYTELGKLYQDVTYYDKAIIAFQKTLTYLSPDAQPHDYAITSGNLSQALTYKAYLANDHKSWQEVLDILQPACEKYKQVGRMDLYGAGSLNIALAYWNLAELTEKDSEKLVWLQSVETNARLATQYLVDNEWQWRDRLDAYVLAGDACKELAYLEKPNEYFPKAVVYYKQSLDKRLISIAALTYANVNHNIGRILVHLRKEPESIPYLREAEKYYRINNELEQANLIRQNLVLIESPARQFVQGFKNWLNRKQ